MATIIPFYPPPNGKKALEIKLSKELERPSALFSPSFLEDIYSILTLREWSDDLLLQLIKTPNLLQQVAETLHNDDIFSMFFEQRTIDLTVELIES